MVVRPVLKAVSEESVWSHIKKHQAERKAAGIARTRCRPKDAIQTRSQPSPTSQAKRLANRLAMREKRQDQGSQRVRGSKNPGCGGWRSEEESPAEVAPMEAEVTESTRASPLAADGGGGEQRSPEWLLKYFMAQPMHMGTMAERVQMNRRYPKSPMWSAVPGHEEMMSAYLVEQVTESLRSCHHHLVLFLRSAPPSPLTSVCQPAP